MTDKPIVTKSGKVLTDADILALADEAEAGYDVSHLVARLPDLSSLPDRLAARPVDPRNHLPIPFVNDTGDGADFAVIQAPRTLLCAEKHLCGICGQRLTYWIAFLGGPQSAEAGTYSDPPMHEECAEASTVLCPHIARRAPHRSRKIEKRADVHTPAGFVEEKPPGFVMVITRSFTLSPSLIYHAGTIKRRRFYEYDDEGILRFDREESY